MNRIVRIFNELIQHKIAHYYGDILLDCKLIERGYAYRYDLLFVFNREYNNPRIQLQSVLETCDMLFDWVDLRDMGGLSIVIITVGKNRHYSYFELMDEISKDGGYQGHHMIFNHPKYRQYQEWKEQVRRTLEKEKLISAQNTHIQELKKRKFLFW
jgi:hypothetical protein